MKVIDRDRLFAVLSDRLNDHLCGMREGCDDSVTGFNEAWDVMRKLFDDIEKEWNLRVVDEVVPGCDPRQPIGLATLRERPPSPPPYE